MTEDQQFYLIVMVFLKRGHTFFSYKDHGANKPYIKTDEPMSLTVPSKFTLLL